MNHKNIMFQNPNNKIDGKLKILRQQQLHKYKAIKRQFGQTKSASLQHGI